MTKSLFQTYRRGEMGLATVLTVSVLWWALIMDLAVLSPGRFTVSPELWRSLLLTKLESNRMLHQHGPQSHDR